MTTRDGFPTALTAVEVLDVLLEEKVWLAEPGQTLVSLATRTFGYPCCYGSREYHSVSRAVLMLEKADFVKVDRAHRDEPGRANTVLGIYLQ